MHTCTCIPLDALWRPGLNSGVPTLAPPTACPAIPTGAKKIPIKGLVAFAPCPVKPLLAAFVPESKGQPAVATIVDYSGAEPVTVSRKSFYRSNGAQQQL